MTDLWYPVSILFVFFVTFVDGGDETHAQIGLNASNKFSEENQPIQAIEVQFFLDELISKYGFNDVLSVEDMDKFIQVLKNRRPSSEIIDAKNSNDSENKAITTKLGVGNKNDTVEEPTLHGLTDDAYGVCDGDGWTFKQHCLQRKCMSGSDIFLLHNVSNEADASQLHRMSPAILYEVQKQHCTNSSSGHLRLKKKPNSLEVWGYGFLCVTLINLCALCGLVFLPLMGRQFYKKLLLFMAALAVGTLAGSSILVLIPECFQLHDEDTGITKNSYVWKSTAIVGGIYLFFLIERILKIFMDWRHSLDEIQYEEPYSIMFTDEKTLNSSHKDELPVCSVKTRSISHKNSMNMSFKPPNHPESATMNGISPRRHTKSETDATFQTNNLDMDVHSDAAEVMILDDEQDSLPAKESSSSSESSTEGIRSVAWMIIVGDGFHNFIDGLSIGAAFAGSILAGVSVSVAVICEELPHELGDFAILLNSGMTMRQALGYNFISACMCYLGLVAGIIVGEATEGSIWIFAIAGGMFLYISLVDLLPEVTHAGEEEAKLSGHHVGVFLLQNLGLLSGYGIILLLTLVTGNIDFESV